MHNGRWVVNGYISHQGNTRRAQRNMGKAQIGTRRAQGNTRQTRSITKEDEPRPRLTNNACNPTTLPVCAENNNGSGCAANDNGGKDPCPSSP